MSRFSIIIPAYNEELRLGPTLERIEQFLHQSSWTSAEVIVVDDGSSDGTADLVKAQAATRRWLRLVSNPGNCGKGCAVKNGMLAARGDWRLLTDADLSSPIEEFHSLYREAQAQQAQIAIGSRAVDRKKVSVHQSLSREMSGRFFNLVMRAATGLPFRDTQCGFKLFSRRAADIVFPRQQISGFGFDVEILYIAQKHRLKTVEVPVSWANVEGSKVSFAGGLHAFTDLWQVRQLDSQGKYD